MSTTREIRPSPPPAVTARSADQRILARRPDRSNSRLGPARLTTKLSGPSRGKNQMHDQ